MRFLPVHEIRRREAGAIALGTPAGVLMERAGNGLVRAVARLLAARSGTHVVAVAGKGNNGGDVFVAVRLLESWGVRCSLLLTCPPENLRGAARDAWESCAAVIPRDRVEVLQRGLRFRFGFTGAGILGDAVGRSGRIEEAEDAPQSVRSEIPLK